MTLALYGKSRKRRGSLLLAALLAVIAASIGGLAIVSSAFAHHILVTQVTPTCTDQTWSVSALTQQWSDYREVAISGANSSPITLRFSPFIGNSSDVSIINTTTNHGTGAINSSGTLTQYTGTFSTDVAIDGITRLRLRCMMPGRATSPPMLSAMSSRLTTS